MNNEQMQAAIKELQDAVIVMAHIEKRQSEVLNDLSEFQIRAEQFRAKTEQNLSEITDKLNGLIGYIEGQRPS